MKLLKIQNINKDFYIESGNIYNVNIENLNLYYKLINALLNYDEEIFIYSEDYEQKSFTKNSLIINNIFDLDINSKKILNGLYKRISNEIIDQKDKLKIDMINSELIELLNKISMDLSLDIDFLLDLDITKILNLYNFSFKCEGVSPLEKIVNYIKANLEVYNFKFVVTNNLISLLSNEDISLLSKELSYLNLSLINIALIRKNKIEIVDNLTIDDDLCEF